jgi:hypothetical protein
MSSPVSRWRARIPPGRQPGELGENEKWWAERQKALEQVGYMLRPRYHPDRKPSWAGTNKFYLDFEDGQPERVSVGIFRRRSMASMAPVRPGHGCYQNL